MESQNRLSTPSITGLPLSGRVVAVWVLLALNVGMFFVTQAFSFWLTNNSADPICRRFSYECSLLVLGWKDNSLIYLEGQYWRLLTATFLHGGIAHIFMNAFSLYIIGPDTERIYGTWRFLAVYMLAGLSGSVLSYAFSPNPSVGASGAIFGLFGALGVFFFESREVLGELSSRQLQGLVALLLINLFVGFTSTGIDNFGHIGGLLGGLVVGWMLVPRYKRERLGFTPRLVKSYHPQGWLGAGIVLIVLSVAVVLITPPL